MPRRAAKCGRHLSCFLDERFLGGARSAFLLCARSWDLLTPDQDSHSCGLKQTLGGMLNGLGGTPVGHTKNVPSCTQPEVSAARQRG